MNALAAPALAPPRLPLNARPLRRIAPSPDRVLEHPATGERLTFLQTAAETDGRYLLVDLAMPSGGAVATPHVLLRQDETFGIRAGRIWLQQADRITLLMPGETRTVPAGTPCYWWNPSPGEATVRLRFEPAHAMEHYLRTSFGLARDGRVDSEGRLWPLQFVLLARACGVYAAGLPISWQRVLYAVLAPLARLFGHRECYARYAAPASRVA